MMIPSTTMIVSLFLVVTFRNEIFWNAHFDKFVQKAGKKVFIVYKLSIRSVL